MHFGLLALPPPSLGEVSRKIRQAESHAQAEDVKFACEILEKILKVL